MAKGKNKIPKRYIKAIDKKIKDTKDLIPDWLKELKKERKENPNDPSETNY